MVKKCILEDKEIVRRYENGESSIDISVGSGIGERAIRLILHKHNVEMRSGRKRKWLVNESFFDEWSKEMAYVLGFAFADSTASRNCIVFFQKEAEILNKIKRAVCSTAPLQYKDNLYHLPINSKRIINKLKEFKIIGNKTYTKKFPEIKEEYKWSFVRGFFDGDGHINKKGNYLTFSCCSKDFSYPLYEFLKSEELKVVLKEERNTIRVVVSGYESLSVMREKMYRDSEELFIGRKKERLYQI